MLSVRTLLAGGLPTAGFGGAAGLPLRALIVAADSGDVSVWKKRTMRSISFIGEKACHHGAATTWPSLMKGRGPGVPELMSGEWDKRDKTNGVVL